MSDTSPSAPTGPPSDPFGGTPPPSEPRQRTLRNRRVWLIVAVVGVVLLGLLVVGNWWETNRELDHLLDNIEASEASMKATEEQMKDLFGQMDTSTPLATASNRQLLDQVQSEARHEASTLAVSRAQIEDLTIAPWNGDLERARDAYVDHIDAWSANYTELGTDPSAWSSHRDALALDIETTWRIATIRFEDAPPTLALHDAQARIDAIFAEQPPGPGQT